MRDPPYIPSLLHPVPTASASYYVAPLHCVGTLACSNIPISEANVSGDLAHLMSRERTWTSRGGGKEILLGFALPITHDATVSAASTASFGRWPSHSIRIDREVNFGIAAIYRHPRMNCSLPDTKTLTLLVRQTDPYKNTFHLLGKCIVGKCESAICNISSATGHDHLSSSFSIPISSCEMPEKCSQEAPLSASTGEMMLAPHCR